MVEREREVILPISKIFPLNTTTFDQILAKSLPCLAVIIIQGLRREQRASLGPTRMIREFFLFFSLRGYAILVTKKVHYMWSYEQLSFGLKMTNCALANYLRVKVCQSHFSWALWLHEYCTLLYFITVITVPSTRSGASGSSQHHQVSEDHQVSADSSSVFVFSTVRALGVITVIMGTCARFLKS